MAFDAGSLLSFLKLDTSGFSSGLVSATTKAQQFNKGMGKTDKQVKEMAGTMSGLGKLMLTGLGFFAAFKAVTAFTGAISDSIGMAADLEKSMANVATLVDTTVVSMDGLTDSVLEMTSEVLKSADDLSAGLYQVFSAGVTDSAEAMEVLRVSAIAATAGLSTTLTSVDALTTIINAYGLEAKDATEISDLMFQTVKLGKTTFDQLAQAIGTVISPAASVGIELDELFASLATLTKGGINTNRATTALRATLLSVIKPGAEAKKAAERLGLEWNAASLKAKGLVQFLADLREATGGNSEIIAELVPNVRALNAVMALTGKQFDELIDIQRQFEDRSGSTAEAFKEQADTYDAQVKRLGLVFDRLKTNIGKDFINVLRIAIEFLADTFDIATEKVDVFGEAVKKMRENIKGVDEVTLKKATEELTEITNKLSEMGISLEDLAGKSEIQLSQIAGTIVSQMEDVNRETEEMAAVLRTLPLFETRGFFDDLKNSISGDFINALKASKTEIETTLLSMKKAIEGVRDGLTEEQKPLAIAELASKEFQIVLQSMERLGLSVGTLLSKNELEISSLAQKITEELRTIGTEGRDLSKSLEQAPGTGAFLFAGMNERLKNIKAGVVDLLKELQKVGAVEVIDVRESDILPKRIKMQEESNRLTAEEIELLEQLVTKSKELGKTELEIFNMVVAGSEEKLQKTIAIEDELIDKQKDRLNEIFTLGEGLKTNELLLEEEKLQRTIEIGEKSVVKQTEQLNAIFAIRKDLSIQEQLLEFARDINAEEQAQKEIDRAKRVEDGKRKSLESFNRTFRNAGKTQLQILERDQTKALAREDLTEQNKTNIRTFFAEKRTQIEKQEQQKQLQAAGTFATATGDLANNLNQLLINSGKEGSKELFLIMKVAAIANAIVSTAVGVTRALALGVPLGPPAAALVAAAGAAQIAVIASTALKDGGLVTEPTSTLLGEAGPEAVIPIERGVAPIVEDSVKNVIDEEQRPAFVNLVIVDDIRRLRSVVAQMQAETGQDVVVQTLDRRNNRTFLGANTLGGVL